MIDEDELRRLMAEAADGVPAPGRAPDALLDALVAAPAGPKRPVVRRRPMVLAAAAAVAVLALAVGGLAIADGSRSGRSDTASSAAGQSTIDQQAGVTEGRAPQGGGGTAAEDSTAGGATAAPPGAAIPATTVPPASGGKALGDVPAKVVKTGSVDLEVRKGTFEATMQRITALTVGLGGYVAESSTTEADTVPRGTVTVRVPASSFDQLMTEVRRLGDVRSVTSKGTDVTAQFTDLAARLTALSATRDRLYEVLRGARNVGDIIAVQDRITGVQTEIEQIQGQQRLLEDQAGYGTLALTVGEPGADVVHATSADDGLGAAWREARRRFGNAVEGLVEWSGTAAVAALVLLVLGALAWLAWTRGRRLLL